MLPAATNLWITDERRLSISCWVKWLDPRTDTRIYTFHPELTGRWFQKWLRWVGHTSYIRTIELHAWFWLKNVEGRARLGEDFEYWRITLSEQVNRLQSKRITFCGHGNLAAISIKAENFSTSYIDCSRKRTVDSLLLKCPWIGVQISIWSFATFVCITTFMNVLAAPS